MADGDTTTAATTTAATTTAATTTTAAWHAGLEAELIGHAQNKNWDLTDPTKAFAAAALAHREAQKFIGVPETELLRIPKPSAPEADVKAFWGRIGVPKEPTEYDFSAVKPADGTALDEKFATSLRTALHAAHVTKDDAPVVAKAVIGHFEAAEAARKAEVSAGILAEKEALDRSWGANAEANLFVAKSALVKLAQAAGLPEAKAQQAWDALSKVGGIGASAALEMLRVMGSRMGEDRFVTGGAPGGNNLPMTREAATAEINMLKADPVFRKRYIEGGADETKRMNALHKIAHGQSQAA